MCWVARVRDGRGGELATGVVSDAEVQGGQGAREHLSLPLNSTSDSTSTAQLWTTCVGSWEARCDARCGQLAQAGVPTLPSMMWKRKDEKGWGDRPVLLVLDIRLGLDGVNPVYPETVKSVGIAGARPSSSYYFIGAQGGGLFYLEPHHSRPAVPPVCAQPAFTRSASSCCGGARTTAPRRAHNAQTLTSSTRPPGGALTPVEEAHFARAYFAAELHTFHCERGTSAPAAYGDDDDCVNAGGAIEIEDDWVAPVAPPPAPSVKKSSFTGKAKSKTQQEGGSGAQRALPLPPLRRRRRCPHIVAAVSAGAGGGAPAERDGLVALGRGERAALTRGMADGWTQSGGVAGYS
ncbi:hypothetical protein DFH09DRAFT_1366760 [Mycena vulgaris]|nr:hypothetical protein DFH09DRAFT_1366760 [Mycena vulgaris]